MADIKTKYRRFNGTDFDTIYFKTVADQILPVSDGKTGGEWKGVLSNRYRINGYHWVAPASNSGYSDIILTGEDIKWKNGDNPATVLSIYAKLTAMDVTASGLDKRIADIEKAYGASGDIITTANMDTKITKVGTITSGTWNGTAIADAYIASASKWNGYATSKQDKLTFDTTLSDSTTNVPRSSAVKKYVDDNISTVTAIAQGKTNTFVIDASAITAGADNSKFNISKTNSTKKVEILRLISSQYITDVSGNNIELRNMKIGDIVLTTGEGIKDWFLGAITTAGPKDDGKFIFYQIDSDTPDLTVYALKSSLGTAASKAVSSSGPSANGENLVTEAQVKSFVEGKGYLTSYTNTTYTFAEGTTNGAFTVTPKGGSAQSVKVHGLAAAAYKGVDTAAFATSSTSANLPTTAAVAGTIANRATKIFYGPTQPANADSVVGDIWIDTNN